ncbi:MAG TPA: choice-of-anchor tandem repeat NxxGxxAF-containing protein [Vicinamibacterales bacterium]|nr:choice-of-anchor tandem repeat NxxGxxAF-containing protein [Vicinamibacterales bacterium]
MPLLTAGMPNVIEHAPTQFGIPIAAVSNDAGDLAFLGIRGTGFYYRKAGTPAPVRVLQYGDEIPGMPGSVWLQGLSMVMNANGLAVVNADVGTTNRITRVLVSYDGVTLKTVASGLDTAPNTGGAKYARSISLKEVNANGDVLFTSDLLPAGSTAAALTTAFVASAGGTITRIAGPGDASPGTGGTFATATGITINSSGDVLLQATITGGSGTNGVFVWSGGTLRKVVADGDTNPLGGTFTTNFALVNLRMINSGLVMFDSGGSIFQNTQANGTTVAVAVGSAVPAPMNGTFGTITNFATMSQSGDAVFVANVNGGASANGVFRFRPGSGVEVVARLNEAAPGGGGRVFSGFASISVNASGTVSFQGNSTSGTIGLFQKQAGNALGLVALLGAPTPIGGTFFFNGAASTTLTNGAVFVRTHVMDFAGPQAAHHAAFVFTPGGGTVALMSTADQLPAGARLVIRPIFMTGAGKYLGVEYQNAGGRDTAAVLDVTTLQGGDVATDGDFVNGWGGRWQSNVMNTVMVGPGGHVVMQGTIFDGFTRGAIVVGTFFQPMTTVFAAGMQDTNGRTINTPQLADTLGVKPIAINSAAQVAFTALFNGNRGVWIGTTSSNPVKVAINGDVVSTGQAITSINAQHGGINESGRVLFSASTAAGQGLFVAAAAGATPLKVAQVGDAAPGGGTFSGFGASPIPSFNNLHQVAFLATTSGGTGGGVFLASLNAQGTAYTVEAIALNGAASPIGGTFNLATAMNDVVINDAGAVLFQSDLSGGAADSGIFIRRTAISALETIAYQGQAAPGTAGAFSTFLHGQNNLVGENLMLSPTGEVAFRTFVTPPGGSQIFGYWHVEPGGAIQVIVTAPSTLPAFDGGTATSAANGSMWMFGDRFPLQIPLANSPHSGGLYMYVPVAAPVTTGAGPNVTVNPADSLTGKTVAVTFGNVSGAGTTSVERSSAGPAFPPGYFSHVLGEYYNLSTTASFSGTITVCIDFSDLMVEALPPGVGIRLLQYNGAAWQDISSGPPASNVICGTTTSLGLFSVVAFFGGQADVLWRHDTRGEVWRWTIDNLAVTQNYISTVDPNYDIVGRGDFNADGYFDILWRHKTSGDVWIWLMNGNTPTTQVYVDTVDPAYDILGNADFNGDRMADILWRHKTNGQVWIWLMNGVTPTVRTQVDTVPTVYAIVGSGDMNADGKADILWRNTSNGDVWVWLMDGVVRTSQTLAGTVPDLGYEVAGLADFDGDGGADILWRHATQGHIWIWQMFGATVLNQTFVATVDPIYRIADTSDYDLDEHADILWQHSTVGDVWMWLMDGPVRLSQTLIGTVPDLGYKIIKKK